MLKQEHRHKSTKKGIRILKDGKYYRISNFGAKILEEIELKHLDGTVERVLRIRVCLRGRVFEIMTSYVQFMNGEWIGIHLGLDAEVYHEHISAKEFPKVIAKESNDKHKITKTQKLGFHQHDGEPYFFYNGGSLSADGSNNLALMAEVDGTLNKCKIPMMAEDDVLKELITQFLDLANIIPKNLSLGSLLLAGVLRAVLIKLKLNEVTIFFVGATGCGKTSVALIGQACFGPDFNEPPANWESTPKSIELTALQASCILLLIDDFTKAKNDKETQKVIEYIIGSVGNSVSRGYALSTTKNSDGAVIEAMPLMTGEEIPEMIQSRKERSLFCWIEKGDVEFEVLDGYKKYANAGVYAKVMGQFIVYILKNYDKIQAEIQRIFERYRREAIAILDEGLHNRAPSNYADMMLGFHYFLKFCFTEGHITKKQANEIREYHAKNLIDLLNIQPILHETKDFKKLVKAKLSNVIRHGGFELLKIDSRMNDGVTGKYPANFVGWQDYGEHIFYIQSDRANLIIKQLPKELKKIMGCGEKSFWSNMV